MIFIFSISATVFIYVLSQISKSQIATVKIFLTYLHSLIPYKQYTTSILALTKNRTYGCIKIRDQWC